MDEIRRDSNTSLCFGFDVCHICWFLGLSLQWRESLTVSLFTRRLCQEYTGGRTEQSKHG